MLPILRKAEGFTLLEVLIAVFISGLVFAMLIFGLKTMINNYQALEKNQLFLSKLQTQFFSLQQDFMMLQPRKVTDENGKVQPEMIGTSSSLEWTTFGPHLVRKRYFYDKDKQQFILRRWAVLDPAKPMEYKDTVLFSHVTAFEFKYLNAKNLFVFFWPETNNVVSGQEVESKKIFPEGVSVNMTLNSVGSVTRFFLVGKRI